MPNFTTDDLLFYLYGELSIGQKKELEDALKKEWALRQKLQVLKESINTLDACPLKVPRTQTVEAVKHYANASSHVSK